MNKYISRFENSSVNTVAGADFTLGGSGEVSSKDGRDCGYDGGDDAVTGKEASGTQDSFMISKWQKNNDKDDSTEYDFHLSSRNRIILENKQTSTDKSSEIPLNSTHGRKSLKVIEELSYSERGF